MLALLIGYAGLAGAAPQPTVAQVKAQISSLSTRLDRVSQQYDQVSSQLSAARARLAQAQRAAAAAQAQFSSARSDLARIAAAAYEGQGQNPAEALLVSGDPDSVLRNASLLQEVAAGRGDRIQQVLTDARHLAGVQSELQRTESGIAALRDQLSGQRHSLSTLLANQRAVLASLTPVQQVQVIKAAAPGTGGTTSGTYVGPVSSAGDKAVAFAYAQLGKPYVWGATGPDAYDCSGLAQAAWAAAGVAIPRVTYDQWAALPHVPFSQIQPGDLMLYDGEGHVAIYVGDGYIIDAPQTGMDVQKIPMNTPWYAAMFDGAVRP